MAKINQIDQKFMELEARFDRIEANLHRLENNHLQHLQKDLTLIKWSAIGVGFMTLIQFGILVHIF